MALESGTHLGHYEVTDQIGKGGMGEVYRALDTILGREVAIKVLPSEFSRDEERLARLEREARMLAALNHPNIAAIYGLEHADDTRFLVLELVEGETLADRLKHGAIPVEESLRLALQIVEALEAAHEKGVIHRDLKPANIKITPDGKVKVLDFGLAKAFVGDAADVNLSNSPTLSMQATQAGIILGTAAYMSPEQAKGLPADRRADVFAFGCVLFEMLTGRQAFQGQLATEILASVIAREPDYDTLQPNLHPKIRELLLRCLEKEPANRWQAVGDLRFEIERVLRDPAGLVPQPLVEAAPVLQSKLPWIAAVAGTFVVGVAVWILKPEPVIPPPQVVRSVISPVDHPPVLFAGRNIAISPDGRQVVYITQPPQLYQRNLDELEGGPIRGPEVPFDPFYSPDGAEIGFTSGVAVAMARVASLGGPTVELTPLLSAPRGASWGPDGAIVFASQAAGLQRVPGVGGEVETLAAGTNYWPEVLPDGNAVLFTVVSGPGPQNHQVAVLDLATGEQEVLVPAGSHPRYAASGHLVYAVGDTLWAVTFDPDQLTVLGDPVPVLEGVSTNPAGGSEFALSDNGSLVYITQVGPVDAGGGGGPPDLRLTLFDRAGNQQLLGAPPRPYRNPRVSPDGTQIAVEIVGGGNESSIWVYAIGGGAAIRRLTQVSEGNNTRPIWTPDGERITFSSDRDGAYSVYSQPADGSGPAERLTTAEEGTWHLPESWSPDGVLTFALTTGPPSQTNWELWTRDADGEIALYYDVPNLNQFGSVFSPDGRWLAYSSAETGPGDFRIFVERYPDGVRYEVVASQGAWPVWSPDGTELFYRLSGNAGALPTLNRLSIETEPVFTFGTEETVFAEGFSVANFYRDFDPLPGGDRFVMLTVADAPTESENQDGEVEPQPDPQVILVQGFFEELKRLVPVP